MMVFQTATILEFGAHSLLVVLLRNKDWQNSKALNRKTPQLGCGVFL